MKKLISIVLLMAVLVSLCACGEEETTATTTAPVADAATEPLIRDETQMTPQELYGHIDQTVPQDGVYKLWNGEGVKLIAQHPDATFEILCQSV